GEMEKLNLPARATQLGERLRQGLSARLAALPGVTEIRGQGLMVGIELDRPCLPLVGAALEQGLLINVTADKTIRLLPALVMEDAAADQLIAQLGDLVEAFLSTTP
ncbi:aminotransferase class III-fold pyridoxal phosphate-dependent enzyme, partial [Methylogaea oryzae]